MASREKFYQKDLKIVEYACSWTCMCIWVYVIHVATISTQVGYGWVEVVGFVIVTFTKSFCLVTSLGDP